MDGDRVISLWHAGARDPQRRRKSWQSRLLGWALRRWIKPQSLREQDVATSRALTSRVPFRAKLLPGWHIRGEQTVALSGEWIEPVATTHPARRHCILYFHGGAYVAMSPRTHRLDHLAPGDLERCRRVRPRLPAGARAPVSSRARRCDGGLSRADRRGHPASRIVLAGDFARRRPRAGPAARPARLRGAPRAPAYAHAQPALPAGAVLFSPWTDLAATGPSLIDNDAVDLLFFGAWVGPTARHYLGDTPGHPPLGLPGLCRPDRPAAAADPGQRLRGAARRFAPHRRKRPPIRRRGNIAGMARAAPWVADLRPDPARGTCRPARCRRFHPRAAGPRKPFRHALIQALRPRNPHASPQDIAQV